MLNVSVISPERVLFEGTVDRLVAPAFDGEVGILPRHAPMMALLGKGELRLGDNGSAGRFQIEGGYNGPGQPANNWAGWEQAGRVERSGIALDFWNDWEHQLDLATAAGCDAFRLSVEWARCEPAEGEYDFPVKA